MGTLSGLVLQQGEGRSHCRRAARIGTRHRALAGDTHPETLANDQGIVGGLFALFNNVSWNVSQFKGASSLSNKSNAKLLQGGNFSLLTIVHRTFIHLKFQDLIDLKRFRLEIF